MTSAESSAPGKASQHDQVATLKSERFSLMIHVYGLSSQSREESDRGFAFTVSSVRIFDLSSF